MTDKDIKDYCKNCDVEPPAMRFKCPECEYNPDKEPIIIDGINVVDCNYIIDYDPTKKQGTWGGAIHKGACKIYSKDCKHNPDCYFKQLARKTEECERSLKRISDLEERIINHSNEIEEYCSRLADKNKECEELKERLVKTEEDLKYQCVDCMNVKSDHYRKALEGIEKVINNILNSCLGRNTVSCRPAHNVCGDLINILDIINKARG